MLRMEDRVLLDAGGLLPSVLAGAGYAEPAFSEPAFSEAGIPDKGWADVTGGTAGEDAERSFSDQPNAMASGTLAAAAGDSQLTLEGDLLVLRDLHGGRDNQFVISADSAGVTIADTAGFTISSSLTVGGSGSNVVQVPWSELGGATRWQVDLAGGDSAVLFDLRDAPQAFLSRVASVQIRAASQSSAAARVSILATDTVDGLLAPGAGAQESLQLRLNAGTDSTQLLFAPTITSELGGFRTVTVQHGATGATSGGAAQSLLVGSGAIEADSGQPALALQFGNLSAAYGQVVLRDNQTLQLGSFQQSRSGAEITILEPAVAHGNQSIAIDTGRLRVEGGLQAVERLQLTTSGDVLFAGDGYLDAPQLEMTTLAGAILVHPDAQTTQPMLRAGTAVLRAHTGIGTSPLPLRTAIGQLDAQIVSKGSMYFEEADALTVNSAIAQDGAIFLRAGGPLELNSVRVGINSEPDRIDLIALRGNVTINGTIQKPRSNSSPAVDIRVVAANGAIVDAPTLTASAVRGFRVELISALGIGTASNPIQTSVEDLRAEANVSGGIYFQDTSDLRLTARLQSGPLQASANRSLTVAEIDARGQRDDHDLSLTANRGPLVLEGPIRAGASPSTQADVTLVALRGAIETPGDPSQIRVTGDRLTVQALSGLGTAQAPFVTAVQQIAGDLRGGLWLANQGNLTLGIPDLAPTLAVSDQIDVSTTGTLRVVAPLASLNAALPLRLVAGVDAIIDSRVSTTTGPIRIEAGNDLIGSAAAVVATETGDLRLIADRDQNGAGTIRFDGRIDAGQGNVTTRLSGEGVLRGSFAGSGRWTKDGAGTLRLTRQSVVTFSGQTQVLQGTLAIDTVFGPAGTIEVLGQSVLTGGGDVRARVFSTSPNAQLISGGDLRLGDGSAQGFDWAGTIVVPAGTRLTLRDADLAELGRITSLAPNSILIAENGVEVGVGDRLEGDGRVIGDVVVRSQGTLDPSTSIDVVDSVGGDLILGPGAELAVRLDPSGNGDRVVVNGVVDIDQAVLRLQGLESRVQPNQVLVVIANDGADPIRGRFTDASGQVFQEGATVSIGDTRFLISYFGGPGGNDLVLIAPDQPIFFMPVDGNADGYVFFVPPQIDVTLVVQEEPAVPLMPSDAASATSQAGDEAPLVAVESEVEFEFRLFFRVVDDALMIEGEQEFDLDPEAIKNLPAIFEKYPFVDGHYRVYFQEAGSRRERLILDVHVYEGRVVPENFRKQVEDVEREFEHDLNESGAPAAEPPAPQPESSDDRPSAETP